MCLALDLVSGPMHADIFEDAANPLRNGFPQPGRQLWVFRQLPEPKPQRFRPDEIVAEQHPDEISVLVAEGDELTRGEVVGLGAPSGRQLYFITHTSPGPSVAISRCELR